MFNCFKLHAPFRSSAAPGDSKLSLDDFCQSLNPRGAKHLDSKPLRAHSLNSSVLVKERSARVTNTEGRLTHIQYAVDRAVKLFDKEANSLFGADVGRIADVQDVRREFILRHERNPALELTLHEVKALASALKSMHASVKRTDAQAVETERTIGMLHSEDPHNDRKSSESGTATNLPPHRTEAGFPLPGEASPQASKADPLYESSFHSLAPLMASDFGQAERAIQDRTVTVAPPDSKHALAADRSEKPASASSTAQPTQQAQVSRRPLLSHNLGEHGLPDQIEGRIDPLVDISRSSTVTNPAPAGSKPGFDGKGSQGSVVFHKMNHRASQEATRASVPIASDTTRPPTSKLSTVWGRHLLRELEGRWEAKKVQLAPDQATRLQAKLERLAQIAEEKSQPLDGASPDFETPRELANRAAKYVAIVDRASTADAAWNAVLSTYPVQAAALKSMRIATNQ